MEMFDPGQRAETRERIASESLQKIRKKFYEVAGHVGRVKIVVTNHLRKMFLSRIHKASERNTAAWITFCCWGKQQSADNNIIQLHLTLICTKDQSCHFCDSFLVSKCTLQHQDRGLTKCHAGSEQTLVQCFPTSGSRPIGGSRSYFRWVAKHF